MEVIVYLWLVVGLLMAVNFIWTWITESSSKATLAYSAPESPEAETAAAEPLDLDDQTGYCEHCNSLMPSRDGQCLTCGSVVHGH